MSYLISISADRPISREDVLELTGVDGVLLRHLDSADSTAWIEDGKLHCPSPSRDLLECMISFARSIDGRLHGEDGVEIHIGVLDQVHSLIASMGIDVPEMPPALAQVLSDLTDPDVPGEESQRLLDEVTHIPPSLREGAAAYLVARAVECGGDPEERVCHALAYLYEHAMRWLELGTRPLDKIAPKIRQRAIQIHSA